MFEFTPLMTIGAIAVLVVIAVIFVINIRKELK